MNVNGERPRGRSPPWSDQICTVLDSTVQNTLQNTAGTETGRKISFVRVMQKGGHVQALRNTT